MALPLGSRVGVYEIVEPIGRGGMGEVWRARDTKLDRDVALKILPEAFVHDADRVARFTREAKTLAALNHPHIAGIHGIEETGGVTALVMELVEGEGLDEKLASGAGSRESGVGRALPLDEALAIARQIAEALEAAHEQGIVHRDLKPANVKVRPDGTAKVLDFGLAKAMETGVGSRESGVGNTLANSPTITSPAMTQAGVILGTAAYMAPEQALGKHVDKRADIWSFGVVLWEMLTGRTLFQAASVPETLAAVIRADIDVSALPPSTPPSVRRLIARCLDRNPATRLRDIGEARILLHAPGEDAPAPAPAPPAARSWMPATAAAIVAAAAVAYAAWTLWPSAANAPPFRFAIGPPPATTLDAFAAYPSFAISPDGRSLAFIVGRGTRSMLAIRPLDAFDSLIVGDSEDAWAPFWSPDSRQVGFFTNNQLKRVAAVGGRPETIANFSDTSARWADERAGTWSADGTIVLSGADRLLMKVSSNGGRLEQAMPAAPADDDAQHAWPSFLPDGRRFLFNVIRGARTGQIEAPLYVGSLDGGTPQLVRDSSTRALFVEPGVLLSVSQGTLFAEPFDRRRLTVSSPATPVARGIVVSSGVRASFTASDTGVVVYRPPQAVSQLVWVSRSGAIAGRVGEPGDYANARLSPDGQSVAAEIHSTDPGGQVDGNIWVANLTRGLFTKLTFDTGAHSASPVWSPDGKSVAYRHENQLLLTSSMPAAAEPARVAAAGPELVPLDWSADGRTLIYGVSDPKNHQDIWIASADGSRAPVAFTQSPSNEREARLSADGRWLAYVSDESGPDEVYVRPFPSGPGKWRISSSGGRGPRWRADGTELFYVAADGTLMVVPVRTTRGFEADAARALFDARIRENNNSMDYEVSRDGQRFLINERLAVPNVFNVISNWRAAQQP